MSNLLKQQNGISIFNNLEGISFNMESIEG